MKLCTSWGGNKLEEFWFNVTVLSYVLLFFIRRFHIFWIFFSEAVNLTILFIFFRIVVFSEECPTCDGNRCLFVLLVLSYVVSFATAVAVVHEQESWQSYCLQLNHWIHFLDPIGQFISEDQLKPLTTIYEQKIILSTKSSLVSEFVATVRRLAWLFDLFGKKMTITGFQPNVHICVRIRL